MLVSPVLLEADSMHDDKCTVAAAASVDVESDSPKKKRARTLDRSGRSSVHRESTSSTPVGKPVSLWSLKYYNEPPYLPSFTNQEDNDQDSESFQIRQLFLSSYGYTRERLLYTDNKRDVKAIEFTGLLGYGSYGAVISAKEHLYRNKLLVKKTSDVAMKMVKFDCSFYTEDCALRSLFYRLYATKRCPNVCIYYYSFLTSECPSHLVSWRELTECRAYKNIERVQRAKRANPDSSDVPSYGWIVTEQMHGDTLLNILRSRRRLSCSSWRSFAFQLCYAVASMHVGMQGDYELLHRDISLKNIMAQATWNLNDRSHFEQYTHDGVCLSRTHRKLRRADRVPDETEDDDDDDDDEEDETDHGADKCHRCDHFSSPSCHESSDDDDNVCHIVRKDDIYYNPYDLQTTQYKCLLKLIDYGSSRMNIRSSAARKSHRITSSYVTIPYRAPELLFFTDAPIHYTQASDTYSLGMVLVSMLCDLTADNRDDPNPLASPISFDGKTRLVALFKQLVDRAEKSIEQFSADDPLSEEACLQRTDNNVYDMYCGDSVDTIVTHVVNLVHWFGVPDDQQWPGVSHTVLYQFIKRHESLLPLSKHYSSAKRDYATRVSNYRQRIVDAIGVQGLQLLSSMLAWDPRMRPPVSSVLDHSVFRSLRVDRKRPMTPLYAEPSDEKTPVTTNAMYALCTPKRCDGRIETWTFHDETRPKTPSGRLSPASPRVASVKRAHQKGTLFEGATYSASTYEYFVKPVRYYYDHKS